MSADIDLTLDSFLIPNLVGYTQPFGTKVTATQFNKGGLSTAEVNQNVMMAFAKMRPVPIAQTAETTDVEYDAKLKFNADIANTATLTLGNGTYEGCTVTILNLSAVENRVSITTDAQSNPNTRATLTMDANSMLHLAWNGNRWINVQIKVATVAPQIPTSGDIWVETDLS